MLRFSWPGAGKCPQRTLVALKREAIFGQCLSLIQDEIRGSYRTTAAIQESRVSGRKRPKPITRQEALQA